MPKSVRPPEILTPSLIKAARALLDFSQGELAAAVGLSRKTISYVEMMPSEKLDARRGETLETIRSRLHKDFHVRFVFEEDGHGEGVYLLKPSDPTKLAGIRKKARSTAKDEPDK